MIKIKKKIKEKKQNTLDSINALYEGRELVSNAFRSVMFPMEEKQEERLETLTPSKWFKDYQ